MPEPATPTGQHLARWQSVLVVAIGLVLVAHTVLLALWLAPSSPLRDSVGDGRLATYVDPYFRQGDETVGIGSNRVDEALSLRARVRPEGGGESRVTPWIDVTAGETRTVAGDVDPARSHQIARRLATNLNFALFALTPQQRGIIADTAADVPVSRLQQQLQAGGAANRRDVENFVANDQMATQYASLWLGARYPDLELLQVQYRVGRRSVPDLDDREAPKVTSIDFAWFGIGSRPAFRADPEARASFEDYVASPTPVGGASRG